MANEAAGQAPELRQTWFPHHYTSGFRQSVDTVWLRVIPKTFRPDINVQIGANKGAESGPALYFLLPKSYSFGVDHEWEDLSTISGAIREVKIGFEKAAAQMSGFTGLNVANAYGKGQTKKNDNPYVYSNSSRRKLSLQLEFGAYQDPKYEVWNPIQALIMWSSADKRPDKTYDTTVNFPYVFRLQTVNGQGHELPLISIDNACIQNVMPTYEEPYRNGYPMKASCTVEFTDIDPTYRSLMRTGDNRAKITTATDSGGAVDTAKSPDKRPSSGGQMGRRSTTTVTKTVIRQVNGQIVQSTEETETF